MQTESLEDRGRLSSHVYKLVHEQLTALLGDEQLCDDEDLLEFALDLQKKIFLHENTWGKNRTSARESHDEPEMTEPWNELPVHIFEETTGWSPTDFLQMTKLLVLVSEVVKTTSRRVASRRLAIFILLARWTNVAGSWTALARLLRMHRGKLIDVYETIVELIYKNEHYHALSTTLDVPRILERVPEFARAVWEKGGLLDLSTIGFVDGTSKATCRPSIRSVSRSFLILIVLGLLLFLILFVPGLLLEEANSRP